MEPTWLRPGVLLEGPVSNLYSVVHKLVQCSVSVHITESSKYLSRGHVKSFNPHPTVTKIVFI
jgi:hypothetical protein